MKSYACYQTTHMQQHRRAVLNAACLTYMHIPCSDPSHDVTAAETGGCNIIVGTPGRIHDVMQRSKLLDARKLEVLVLDEADRLLDLGFKEQLDSIMACLPRQRRTGMLLAPL